MVPKAAIIGMLVNPNYRDAEIQVRDARPPQLRLGCNSTFSVLVQNARLKRPLRALS